MNIRVYVAGPITKGDQFLNLRAAVDAGHELRERGYFPFVPHLFSHWHTIHPREYESWMELDFEWLSTCHAVLRLEGESAGADRECWYAQSMGIPVFTTVDDLHAHMSKPGGQ